MRKPVKNIGASIRARLLNLAKERNQPFDLLLTRYTLERLLYRLSLSRYRDRFVLKGAMLLASAMDDPHRPTRDLDLLGFGDPDPNGMIEAFRQISDLLISGLRVEGSGRRNSGSRQLVVQKMGFATVDR